jgi:hypothetical protein
MGDRRQSIIRVHGLMSRGREKMRNVLSLSSMQSFLLSNCFMQNFVVFVKHTKLYVFFKLTKLFIIVKPWLHAKKKNPVYENQGWEPIHQKYKAYESKSRHNPKKKRKQTINKFFCVLWVSSMLLQFELVTFWVTSFALL